MPPPKNMLLLDANVILRYLLADDASMADKAEEWIGSGLAHATMEVLAEVVYVLQKVYGTERRDIAETVSGVLRQVQCTENRIAEAALATYAETKLDFVDCVLCARHRIGGDEIATFDKPLLKYLARP